MLENLKKKKRKKSKNPRWNTWIFQGLVRRTCASSILIFDKYHHGNLSFVTFVLFYLPCIFLCFTFAKKSFSSKFKNTKDLPWLLRFFQWKFQISLTKSISTYTYAPIFHSSSIVHCSTRIVKESIQPMITRHHAYQQQYFCWLYAKLESRQARRGRRTPNQHVCSPSAM